MESTTKPRRKTRFDSATDGDVDDDFADDDSSAPSEVDEKLQKTSSQEDVSSEDHAIKDHSSTRLFSEGTLLPREADEAQSRNPHPLRKKLGKIPEIDVRVSSAASTRRGSSASAVSSSSSSAAPVFIPEYVDDQLCEENMRPELLNRDTIVGGNSCTE